MQKFPMTKEGADKLASELQSLKKEVRPQFIKAISVAREHGDLKENAEYHSAREQQGMVEARIKHIESVLSQAEIIDMTKMTDPDRVVFGATVELLNITNDEKVIYRIVGNEEANLAENKISVSSPIARALIGSEEGDEVIVKAPSGNITYDILSISYK